MENHTHDWRLLRMIKGRDLFYFYCTRCLKIVMIEKDLDEYYLESKPKEVK